MNIDLRDNTDEPEQLSATARILDHLLLHGGIFPVIPIRGRCPTTTRRKPPSAPCSMRSFR